MTLQRTLLTLLYGSAAVSVAALGAFVLADAPRWTAFAHVASLGVLLGTLSVVVLLAGHRVRTLRDLRAVRVHRRGEIYRSNAVGVALVVLGFGLTFLHVGALFGRGPGVTEEGVATFFSALVVGPLWFSMEPLLAFRKHGFGPGPLVRRRGAHRGPEHGRLTGFVAFLVVCAVAAVPWFPLTVPGFLTLAYSRLQLRAGLAGASEILAVEPPLDTPESSGAPAA